MPDYISTRPPNVRVIPARINPFTVTPTTVTKRKVAGYARVSTEDEEQRTSYAAQVDYYTNYIKNHSDWEFVDVYTDDGISGTSTKYREGFQRMVKDALAGKIDLIVTKSVSRFARNTVDSLTTIRKLKEHGTEVYFEKENIWTFDSKGELLLTIMSSLAQEESRSISENIRWGNRKKFSDGRYSMNYKWFLGYDKGPDGKLVINPDQAKVVRRIYALFLTGRSVTTIAKILTKEGIPSPAGKEKWYGGTVNSILQNETYMGDKILQKTYTVDFLHKKQRKNEGQVPMYYIEMDHEPIIPPETFKLVQDELLRRKQGYSSGRADISRKDAMTGRIFCGECGNMFGRKVWHSTDKYRKVVWQCNGKYKRRGATAGHNVNGSVADSGAAGAVDTPASSAAGAADTTGKRCSMRKISEDEIKAAFEEVLQSMKADKEEVIQNLREVLGEDGHSEDGSHGTDGSHREDGSHGTDGSHREDGSHGRDGGHREDGSHRADGSHREDGSHGTDGGHPGSYERSVADLKQQKEKLEQERNAVAERYNAEMLRGERGSASQAMATQVTDTSATESTQSMQTAAAGPDNTTAQFHTATHNHSETLKHLYAEYERLDAEIGTLERMIQEKEMRERKIQAFLEALELPGEEFSESAWCMMVDRVTVLPGKLVFLLANGEEVEI